MNGLGHNIRYWFNNEENYNLINSEEFNYTNSCNDVFAGEFNIPISELNIGSNTLYIEIWDNFNNRTLESIIFNVEDMSFKAYDVYNFPNPFSDITYFTFGFTESSNIDVKINIYALDGNIIKNISSNAENNLDEPYFYKIPWDGRNNNGGKIANGTYIYHLTIIQNRTLIHEGSYKLTKLE